MKIIKLSIIFIVFVGVLILALNWKSVFSPTNNKDDFPTEDLIDIGAKCEEIRQAWEQCAAWDEDLYKSIREDIEQSKSMGMFSREGYNTVNNALRESATNNACDSYLAMLHSRELNDAKLQEQYKGVQSVKTHESLENDLRVKKVEERHKLYTNIKRFVNSRHTISPKFDTESTDWVPFSTLQSGILGTASSYRQNNLFIKEMMHIPGFKSGLDDKYLRTLTDGQRNSFYTKLCAQIIEYFQNETPTPDKIKELDQVYRNFTSQESNYGVAELATFKVNYKEEKTNK